MISEIVSEFMPDDVLICGESGCGKAKSGIIGIGFWGLAGWDFNRWSNIELVCSSWAKKMIILRLKSSGMGLFIDLFVCIVNCGVLCHYMLDGALNMTGS